MLATLWRGCFQNGRQTHRQWTTVMELTLKTLRSVPLDRWRGVDSAALIHNLTITIIWLRSLACGQVLEVVDALFCVLLRSYQLSFALFLHRFDLNLLQMDMLAHLFVLLVDLTVMLAQIGEHSELRLGVLGFTLVLCEHRLRDR